ncbi:putative pectinesterase [Medicago truncatula]|uniref:Pectinesterase n=1 Tax=Medicago truncatula TaxID=3880 RepID=G7I8R5_MEDTR|nr:pectinesterase [Medicago truncatula]XP_003591167.1 pectinesterase [Medicago truncatula]AES61415.1 pectinesterase/pectinesterase inhibitor [Medicago truncatula]AES61418.1 pectinesterase/pectinesterase inhibitor [Medicago truncatula]RHN80811.1 putative pectinesterase [Medicago truncatula]RHN80814.1 putative pectinesterase [Medicago truncatula]
MADSDAQIARRSAIIGVSTLLLVAMIIVVMVGARNKYSFKDDIEDNKKNHVASTMKAIRTICQPTDYKKECEESLRAEAEADNVTDPKELIKIAFNVTIKKIGEKLKETDMLCELEKDPRSKDALDTCKQLMDLSIDEFTRSLDGIGKLNIQNIENILMNLKVWLNGAVTYMDTCLDGFENTTSEAGKKMKELLTSSMHMSSNALAIITDFADTISDMNVTKIVGRRLLQDYKTPSWVEHRKLLDAKTNAFKHTPNVTVALDGSGDFKSINEALKKVPHEESKTPFVIYIKAGVYREYVEVLTNMTHIVFVGDGGKKSIITGNKNFMDGVTTYHTATVAIQGDHFTAINMGFENSAGPQKHQAVALRVQGDKAIFYNCSMDGYQDTLYVHAMRQFYRDCTISGTIDFVFGNAESVFQNCKFVVRKPMSDQQCIVTAQGRKERTAPSAIVIEGGSIVADPEFYPVRFDHKSYLARPWKNFSRTIIMDTFIDDLIHPDGFLPWHTEEGPINMDTCYYAEYHNYGPGSDKSKRVKWAGIYNINTKAAQKFAPSKFFHGGDWIKDTGIPYYPNIPEHKKHEKTVPKW